MARTPKPIVGRPPKPINWNVVEKMMEAGSPAKRIAGAFYISEENFCKRFKKEFGDNFTNFVNEYRSGGEAFLELIQYQKALKGHTKELDKLCNIRLGQSEHQVQESPYQADIEKDHEIMRLRNRLANLEANGNKPQAG